MTLFPIVEPVPHWNVPDVPLAVSAIEPPEQIEVTPVIEVGAVGAAETVTVRVTDELKVLLQLSFTLDQ